MSNQVVDSAKIILAIDTSASEGVIALLKQRVSGEVEVTDFSVSDIRATHSEKLLPAIHQILDRNKLETSSLSAILVGRGPGSFTGLRIGITTANTLGFALKIPVSGFSSLELLEQVYCADSKTGFSETGSPVLVTVRDAFKGEVFVRLKRIGSNSLIRAEELTLEPQVLESKLEEWGCDKNPWVLIGAFDLQYSEVFEKIYSGKLGKTLLEKTEKKLPTASGMLKIAKNMVPFGKFSPPEAYLKECPWILPNYLRASHAEVKLAMSQKEEK